MTMTEAVSGGVSAAVTKIAVVGGGTMGNGIAQAFATSGFDVELVDVKPEFVERALGTIGSSLQRVAKKQAWPAERVDAIRARIHGGTTLEVGRDCPGVIEAVTGSCEPKRRRCQGRGAVARPAPV